MSGVARSRQLPVHWRLPGALCDLQLFWRESRVCEPGVSATRLDQLAALVRPLPNPAGFLRAGFSNPVERARPQISSGRSFRSEAHVSSMPSLGRRPSWKKEERERVLALAEQGASQREIAEAVFGDTRYRGRVERILRSHAAGSNGSDQARTNAGEEASTRPRPSSDLELFHELVARAERSLLDSYEAPSLSAIERLMRVKRQIDALETIEWGAAARSRRVTAMPTAFRTTGPERTSRAWPARPGPPSFAGSCSANASKTSRNSAWVQAKIVAHH
jgi:hypothetical protein